MAERNNLKPSDFEPLTSLPWKEPNATFDGTLEAIYREPNLKIRYPVLAGYLRIIPVGQLGRAFDKCITLECSQTPDDLVAFFLPIWAARDPQACWTRTVALFRVVGFEEGWLDYKAEKDRPVPTVRDVTALRASPFWLDSGALLGFPAGVNASSLPMKQRVALMREFVDKWFDAFGSWPGGDSCGSGYLSDTNNLFYNSLIGAFLMPVEQLRDYVTSAHQVNDELGVEIARRRWLQAEPSAIPEIIQEAREVKWDTDEGEPEQRSVGPSIELMMLWAKMDTAGMIRWADPLDVRKDTVALEAKGMLMSRVDPETRKRWIAAAKSADSNDDLPGYLYQEWAAWDPTAALDAAVATQDAEAIEDAGFGAAYGPFESSPSDGSPSPLNSCGFGLGVLKNFDLASLPPKLRHDVTYGWESVMEEWGSIDIGEAARYGLDVILRTQYARRDLLLRYYRGEKVALGDDGMNDRTFCALRVWAIFHPKEMTAWIDTLDDMEMRKSLMWLLKHAQGAWPSD